jgi:hypothetical protein
MITFDQPVMVLVAVFRVARLDPHRAAKPNIVSKKVTIPVNAISTYNVFSAAVLHRMKRRRSMRRLMSSILSIRSPVMRKWNPWAYVDARDVAQSTGS